MPSPLPLASTAFMYVESDVPAGMTLDAWRRRSPLLPRRGSMLVRILRPRRIVLGD